jgi:hypothetical protein
VYCALRIVHRGQWFVQAAKEAAAAKAASDAKALKKSQDDAAAAAALKKTQDDAAAAAALKKAQDDAAAAAAKASADKAAADQVLSRLRAHFSCARASRALASEGRMLRAVFGAMFGVAHFLIIFCVHRVILCDVYCLR